MGSLMDHYNLTLLSKEKEDPADLMREIVRIVKGPVSLEVVGTKTEEMVEESSIG
jgi:transaldolase